MPFEVVVSLCVVFSRISCAQREKKQGKSQCLSDVNKVIDYQYQELLHNHAGDKSEHTLTKPCNKGLLEHTFQSQEL